MKAALKKVYETLPLKKEAFTLMKMFWTPDQNIYRHLHFHGVFKVDVDGKNSFQINHRGYQIENEIFWRGLNDGWEKTSVGLWQKLVPRAKYIFDVGANTGLFSLIAQSLNPDSKVFAFDPVKRVYKRLKENVTLNKYDVSCFEVALSNDDGEAIIYDLPTDHILSVTVNQNHHSPELSQNAIPTTIKTIRLETFIEKQNIERIDLMKIDVERHEVEVLEGFGKYLEKFRPVMLVEVLSDKIGAGIEKIVSNKGYFYFRIDDADGSVKKMEHIRIEKDCNFLICDEAAANHLQLI